VLVLSVAKRSDSLWRGKVSEAEFDVIVIGMGPGGETAGRPPKLA
jgi:hypothetical protein